MARPFSVATEEQRFRLPIATKQQIRELMDARTMDARAIIIAAVETEHRQEFEREQRRLSGVARAYRELQPETDDTPIIV